MDEKTRIVGVVSFSDGRKEVYPALLNEIQIKERALVEALTADRSVKVLTCDAPVHTPAEARSAARRLVSEGAQCCIFHFAVFGFPQYAVITAKLLNMPVLIYAPQNQAFPSLTGLLCCVTSLVDAGIRHERLWGDCNKERVRNSINAFVRAASARHRLQGSVYGTIGGRSMGLYGATASPGEWMRRFGIDVEYVSELEYERRANEIPETEVMETYKALLSMTDVHFDGDRLDEAKLRMQIRYYLAVRRIIDDYQLDFAGIQCHTEMSGHHAVQCVPVALLNDPYSPVESAKRCFATSCEADAPGALTMQVLHLMSGNPGALLDIRNYDEPSGLFVMSNCGAAPTWFAARQNDRESNYRRTSLHPSIAKYKAGGAHVTVPFMPGEYTAGRLMRTDAEGNYAFFAANCEILDESEYGHLRAPSVWTHAFVKMPCTPQELVTVLNSNHLHFTSGKLIEEVGYFCRMTGTEAIIREKHDV